MVVQTPNRKLSELFLYPFRFLTPPWGPLGYITYRRTYARRMFEGTPNERSEEWIDTCQRVVEGAMNLPGSLLTDQEAERLFYYMFNLKGVVSGRGLWQFGSRTIDLIGGNSLNNCWFTCIDHPTRPFEFAFDNMMLGGGVGVSVQRKYVDQLPEVKSGVTVTPVPGLEADYVLPDTREGWTELVRRTFEAFFVTGESFTYSVELIRPEGTPIKGFGGVASGPKYLVAGIQKIAQLLRRFGGTKITPAIATRLICMLGEIIKSGNVRDAAIIVVGDPDDETFLTLKRWDLGALHPELSNANLSVYCDEIWQLHPLFWEGYKGNGEPYGLINQELARRMGRLGELSPDPDAAGPNPCAEINLAPYEPCNLAEIYVPNIESQEEMNDVAALLFKVCKSICNLDYIHEETNRIVHRNYRTGIGVTGVLQAGPKLDWLRGAYEHLVAVDREIHFAFGLPLSVRRTTVKPSGTLSLLAGVTPGGHPAYARFVIRRIKIAANSPLITICKAHGYRMAPEKKFDGTLNHDAQIVDFYVAYPEGTVTASQMSAVDQLEVVKKLQTDWSDNAVSVTVYFRKEELDDIYAWLTNNYSTSIKSVSFLLHSEHGFEQAPFEEITAEQYRDFIKTVRPITGGDVAAGVMDDGEGCGFG